MTYKELVDKIVCELEQHDIWDDEDCTTPTEEYQKLWDFVCALRNTETELVYDVTWYTPSIPRSHRDPGDPGEICYNIELEGWRQYSFDVDDMLEQLGEAMDIEDMIHEWVSKDYEEALADEVPYY